MTHVVCLEMGNICILLLCPCLLYFCAGWSTVRGFDLEPVKENYNFKALAGSLSV